MLTSCEVSHLPSSREIRFSFYGQLEPDGRSMNLGHTTNTDMLGGDHARPVDRLLALNRELHHAIEKAVLPLGLKGMAQNRLCVRWWVRGILESHRVLGLPREAVQEFVKDGRPVELLKQCAPFLAQTWTLWGGPRCGETETRLFPPGNPTLVCFINDTSIAHKGMTGAMFTSHTWQVETKHDIEDRILRYQYPRRKLQGAA